MNRIRYSVVVCFLFCSAMYGQVSQYIMEVNVPTATEQTSLSVSVDLTQNTQIQRVLLHYREFGVTEYKELDMLLTGRTAVATIPPNVIRPPYIEYYIEMRLSDNTLATFPSENPEVNPIKIPIKGVDPKDLEVRFLSPEQGETLAAEDLAIAVSLMFASDAVDKQRTRIYLDGADVTKEAIFSDDVILYNPKNFNKPLNLGTHSISIDLVDTHGQTYYTKQMNFNLSTAAAIEEEKSALQYMGNAQVELRNEKVDVSNTSYQRGDVRLNGTYKFLTFGYDMHVTNENTDYRQPQNRFLGTLQAADYAKVQIGDAYPVFPSLFISGKRVRGVTGALTLGFLNVDVSYGKTDRFIEGTLGGLVTFHDSSAASARQKETIFQGFGGHDPVTNTDSLIYRTYTDGTYDRKIIAIRPSFGSGENFQLGFSYIRATDDTNSIKYGNYPADNFVAGTDLLIAFDNQRFKWTTQVAFSLENTNISGGNYSDDDFRQYKLSSLSSTASAADSAKALKDAQDLIDLAKIGRKFIIVNPNMSPLDPTAGFPSLAFESELTLNYLNNFVRALVFRRGKNYKSYGNEFIQTDIAGLNVSDRIRLLDNRMMTSFSYETKWDNLQNDNIKPRTTFNTFNGSVTTYPGVKLPSVTLGYGFNTRANQLDLNRRALFSPRLDSLGNPTAIMDTTILPSKADSLNYANEHTDRYFFAVNYDFDFLVHQNFNSTVTIANKKDNTFNLRNQDNVSVATALTTIYKIPLQTTIAVIISHNATYYALQDTVTKSYLSTTNKQTFDYKTFSLNARYRLLKDRLNLLATLAPSFGDFKRMLIQAGADYQIMDGHYIVGQLDLIQYPNKGNDVIASILYRFNF